MQNRKELYYLTMTGPRRGERVIASVSTSDRDIAEKIFGCGYRNEHDFGFDGLYTEEEVQHMFMPGSDIIGTYAADTGQCEKHKDYAKVSSFIMDGQEIYRLKNNKLFLLDLSVSKNSFKHVFAVLSGKIPPVREKSTIPQRTGPLRPVKSIRPAADRQISPAVSVPNDPVSFEIPDTDMPDVYVQINTVHSDSAKCEPGYSSIFGTWFGEAQKTVMSDDDFEGNEKLADYFSRSKFGQPVKKQGQSLPQC